MPQFIPLPFYQYDWSNPLVNSEKVISPPYDVLSAEDKKALGNELYNVVHIDSPASYEHGSRTLNNWIQQGILRQINKASFYIMATRYNAGDDDDRLRWGIFGGLKVHPFEDRVIYPHEQTYPKAKDDRLKLMRATKGQLSPIFGVYDDPGLVLEHIGQQCQDQPPILSFEQEPGIFNRIWSVPEQLNHAIQDLLSEKKIFIADGHHRYETALNYKKTMPHSPEAPWNHIFIYLSNISSPGLEIFPYHRIISWEKTFDWKYILEESKTTFNIDFSPRLPALDDISRSDAFILIYQHGFYTMTPLKNPQNTFEHVGAHVLEQMMLRKFMHLSDQNLSSGNFLSYTHDHARVISKVENNSAQAGILLQPVPMNILQQVCETGQVMPRKSTYFYPKLPTGVLFHLWDR